MLPAIAALLAAAPSLVQDHVLLSVAGRHPDEVRGFPTPEELVGKIRFSHAKTVVLVIHGGLVTAEVSIEAARIIHPVLERDSYPIFVTWETGPGYALFPPRRQHRKEFPFAQERPRGPVVRDHPLGAAERRLERSTRALSRTLWGQMKAFARYANDPLDPEATMTRFTRALTPLWKERDLNVVVLAHSAGAIYAGYWLEALSQWKPDAKIDMMLLSPAATYEFVRARLPVLKRHLRRFTMLGLSDELERADQMLNVPGLPRRVRGWYTGSVLYFVSNNLERSGDTPVLGMERFLRLANGQAVQNPRSLDPEEKATIDEVAAAMALDRTAYWSNGEVGPTASKGHLGYWTDEPTQRSIREFVRSAATPSAGTLKR